MTTLLLWATVSISATMATGCMRNSKMVASRPSASTSERKTEPQKTSGASLIPKVTQMKNGYILIPPTRQSSPAYRNSDTLIDPRSLHRIWLAADKTLRDDHWGECPAWTHPHPLLSDLGYPKYVPQPYDDGRWAIPLDGLCHDNLTDLPLCQDVLAAGCEDCGACTASPQKRRPPKTKFKPDPKATWV